MKTKVLYFVLCILMIGLYGCEYKETTTVDADVLTVNSEILEGKLIGHFLGSSDGWIKSDVIKVGVKFEINDNIFLEDLKLSHAQLAYYKDRDTLPLKVTVEYSHVVSSNQLEIRLDGYYMKDRDLSKRLARELLLYVREKNSKVVTHVPVDWGNNGKDSSTLAIR